MVNEHREHQRDADKPAFPLWATVSWTLAALALLVLVVGLTGLAPIPHFPLVAFGLFVLAVFARFRNDLLFRRRQTAE